MLAVNGKLTDFGSSWNINLLMTNMTFTKGVGTPVFMAPEVPNKEKYKKPADVYSFGVMLYECFVWGDAYPKDLFKYPGWSRRLQKCEFCWWRMLLLLFLLPLAIL